MDINELENYRPGNAVKFHQQLNPQLWGKDEHLLPAVQQKLMTIADDFREFLGINDLELKDITVSGSNAAYTYTDSSDIDLHLVVDLPKADVSEIYRELFDAKKYQYNDQHDFTIRGYDVELYVQNANEPHVSQGIYSVLNKKWIRVPSRREPTVDDISVASKYEDLANRIDQAVKSGDLGQMDNLAKKISNMRRAGLAKTGEFGVENLAFKLLRRSGDLDRLRQARTQAKDQLMSLDERKKKKSKKRSVKWGRFGGLWFPGYHNIGQTDSTDSITPADIGGESAMEDWHPNANPPGAETKPEMPAGTVLVNVSDTYDWYKLGQDISDLKSADPKAYGKGAPQTVLSFGSEPIEHLYKKDLDRLGLKTYDIDRTAIDKDPEDEYRMNEAAASLSLLEKFADYVCRRLGIESCPTVKIKRDPEWSRRNGTFGRFNPDDNTIELSVAGRHPVDVLRTLAHELAHSRQAEQEGLPPGAGATGSPWEDEANAVAGRIMRDFADENSDYFDQLRTSVAESSGYIPVTDREARDPRYSMAITQDIRPKETQRQAAKLGFKTDAAGRPPQARTNGLVEQLTQRLQAIKEGRETVVEDDLFEIAMSPGALKQWAESGAGQNMLAGFEAELIFTGLANSEDSDLEPDYDEDRAASSIEDVIDFFSDGPYSDISRSQINEVRSRLEEEYFDWVGNRIDQNWSDQSADYVADYIEDNDLFDQDEAEETATDYLGADADPDQFDEYVRQLRSDFINQVLEDSFDNRIYADAYEQFNDEQMNDYDQYEWFDNENRYMSDIASEFGLMWPYMLPTGGEDGYNEENAQRLADELSAELGVKTKVSGGYHNAKRDSETWIFEPDGSLDGDDPADMPVEIVSPPMPLSEAIEILPKFFAWAKSQGAYANKSTGFHMSVSMPNHDAGKLDYAKLALFLGDKYVLERFGRAANSYAVSAIEKIQSQVNVKNPDSVAQLLDKMRESMNKLGNAAVADPSGFGKYVSINPKNNYIEFRSAGGKDYFEDIERIQSTLLRYARATDAAMDPEYEQKEYARKLYKLLTNTETEQVTDPRTGRKRIQAKTPEQNADSIWAFSRYAAGELNKNQLVNLLKQAQQARRGEVEPSSSDQVKYLWTLPDRDPNGNFEIFDRRDQTSEYRFRADNATDAVEVLNFYRRRFEDSPDFNPNNYGVRSVVQSNQAYEMPGNTDDGNYEIYSVGSGDRIWRFQARNQAQAQRAFDHWYNNLRNPSAGPAGLRFVDDADEDRVLPFLVTYSLGHDGARSGYRVNARSADEARRVFVAQVRDQGTINMNRLYTWDVEQIR